VENGPETPEDTTRYKDAARVDELIKYLEAGPPYEAVGKVVVAAAELELNLIGLSLALGIDPKKAWYREKRGTFLRSREALPRDILDRIELTAEGRDLISHGVWMNLFDRGQAFLRPDKENLGQNLRGRLVTAEDLAAWRADLLELNELVEAERRRLRPMSGSLANRSGREFRARVRIPPSK